MDHLTCYLVLEMKSNNIGKFYQKKKKKKKNIGKEAANQAKRIRIFSLIFSFEKEDTIFYITSSLRKGQDILCNLSVSLALVRWSTLSAFVLLGECSISTLTSEPKIPIRRARGTVFLNFQLPNGPGPFLVFMFFFIEVGQFIG